VNNYFSVDRKSGTRNEITRQQVYDGHSGILLHSTCRSHVELLWCTMALTYK